MNWIQLYEDDRRNMAVIMRENIACDIKHGYSANWTIREMIKVEEYEKETEVMLKKFRESWNGNDLARRDLKKKGAIA